MTWRKKKVVSVEVIEGVEGKSLVIEDRRVAGPKPWGGGRVALRFNVEVDDIKLALSLRGHARRH